jgi:hypothetical protein
MSGALSAGMPGRLGLSRLPEGEFAQQGYKGMAKSLILLLCGTGVLLMHAAVAEPVSVNSKNRSQVELNCKIVSKSGIAELPANWTIEIKDNNGGRIRVGSGVDGQTVHFKGLNPGIYTVCLMG